VYLHNLEFVSDLRQVGGFLRVLRFPPPIKLIATSPRYNLNIVEHHKPTNQPTNYNLEILIQLILFRISLSYKKYDPPTEYLIL
jgi:hypothetical protein